VNRDGRPPQQPASWESSWHRRNPSCDAAWFGHRSRTLFRAFLELQHGAVPVAGRALLRSMVEINVLVRFLGKNPTVHAELWHAEGDRGTLTIVEEHNRSVVLSKRWVEVPIGTSSRSRQCAMAWMSLTGGPLQLLDIGRISVRCSENETMQPGGNASH
jgi:hypothetical protein